MDKDKEILLLKQKIKKLEDLLVEFSEENQLLWDYLDEIKEQEKALLKEIQIAVDNYIIKEMKPVGDA
jgi:hypothetical protein